MKAAPASFLAMVVGWIVPIVGLVVGQLVTDGRTTDVGVSAFWTGLFALLGWAGAVRPLMLRHGEAAWFRELRYSWLGWSLLGMVVYTAIVVPLFGFSMLVIIWYHATMGALAGPAYALLRR